ncbi:MAG: site-2 protease family protein [Oscillospiraceae bacterium]|nr:site-2 protease family protein [Oscillospiraceae bacterium]
MQDFFRNLDYSFPLELLWRLIPVVICLTVHEFSHALAALKLGDETVRTDGRVSLNPLRHIDWIGLAVLAFAGFGWGRPVQVRLSSLRNPRRDMALIALAGPVSNFILAGLLWFVYKQTSFSPWPSRNLIENTMRLSVGLGLFNMIPIPPLDGSKVLFALLPERIYLKILRYERYGYIILIIGLFLWNYLPSVWRR